MRTHVRKALAGAAMVTVLAASLLVGAAPGSTRQSDNAVARGIERRAATIGSTDPTAPDADLEPLARAVDGAQIVGLGEASHGLAEVTTLKHRTVRYLVERLGFRSIAWEDDWSLGTQIDDYIQGRRDDRDALIGQMSTAWRTQEVAAVIDWLRDYNETHDKKVRFLGVEYFATRPFVYDDIEAYVAEAAPHQLEQAREHLEAIKPTTDDMGAYVDWFRYDVDDKEPYVRHAERLYDLVEAIEHDPKDDAYVLAEHGARQIRSFYTAFTVANYFAFRDARAAENLRWWQENQGGRTIYWAASAHTADVPELTISFPPQGQVTFASAGSFLRSWYGDRYVSVGFTFDHGAMNAGGESVELLPPPEAWFEHPLGCVGKEQFLYDVRRRATPAVREWLGRPLVTRGDPESGPESTMSGGTPGQWFDVIVHRQVVSPATPLSAHDRRPHFTPTARSTSHAINASDPDVVGG
ncbi:erythromycin esterase family protein [Promicromonospora panici]|uniref:erythromycin esterase family protein n=1 Tax=Promicromonospora panici TaxID=2219658 RepID=UPI00101CAC15|nr:erythromycin esterase family protein [Promicromonospora panici]